MVVLNEGAGLHFFELHFLTADGLDCVLGCVCLSCEHVFFPKYRDNKFSSRFFSLLLFLTINKPGFEITIK